MKIEDIKIGDKVRVKKEVSHNLIDCQNIPRDLDFIGTVERINGHILVLDNPAMVNIKHVVEVIK